MINSSSLTSSIPNTSYHHLVQPNPNPDTSCLITSLISFFMVYPLILETREIIFWKLILKYPHFNLVAFNLKNNSSIFIVSSCWTIPLPSIIMINSNWTSPWSTPAISPRPTLTPATLTPTPQPPSWTSPWSPPALSPRPTPATLTPTPQPPSWTSPWSPTALSPRPNLTPTTLTPTPAALP